jgi:DNA-binding transcriptional MerR regulator
MVEGRTEGPPGRTEEPLSVDESKEAEEAAFGDVEMPDKLFFRIGEAAQIVGVEPHVLRYWESEFKMRPQRSSSGQRMYRRKDIARFLRIRKLLHDEGFTIAGARKVLLDGGSEASASGGADAGRLGDALKRIAEVRAKITALQDKYGTTGVAS